MIINNNRTDPFDLIAQSRGTRVWTFQERESSREEKSLDVERTRRRGKKGNTHCPVKTLMVRVRSKRHANHSPTYRPRLGPRTRAHWQMYFKACNTRTKIGTQSLQSMIKQSCSMRKKVISAVRVRIAQKVKFQVPSSLCLTWIRYRSDPKGLKTFCHSTTSSCCQSKSRIPDS